MFQNLLSLQSALADRRTSMRKTYEDAEQAYEQYEQVRDRCEVDRQNIIQQIQIQ